MIALRARLARVALALGFAVALAGCAQPTGGSDRERSGGFYGGVFGGLSRP